MSIELCLELNKQLQGLNARVNTLEQGLTALQFTAALTVTKLLEALGALKAKDFSATAALAIINSCVPLITLINSITGTIDEFLALSPQALFQAYISHALNNLMVQISDAVLGPVNAALDAAIANVASAQAALNAAIISGLGIPAAQAALAAARQAVAVAVANVNAVGSVLHALNDAALCKTSSMHFSSTGSPASIPIPALVPVPTLILTSPVITPSGLRAFAHVRTLNVTLPTEQASSRIMMPNFGLDDAYVIRFIAPPAGSGQYRLSLVQTGDSLTGPAWQRYATLAVQPLDWTGAIKTYAASNFYSRFGSGNEAENINLVPGATYCLSLCNNPGDVGSATSLDMMLTASMTW